MASNLLVTPAFQLKETDVLTVDMFNLMATPVVQMSLEDPVTDANYFRNGNFYSSFWATPAGVPVPPDPFVPNADYWVAYTNGTVALTYQRSSDTPDLYSLFSAQLVGAAGNTGGALFGQSINGDLSATLRRPCTFSGYIENNTGAVMLPQLMIYTANNFNDFSQQYLTLQATLDLPSCPNAAWTYVQVTQDISQLANAANGLFIFVAIPNGALSVATNRVNFSRLKFQAGSVATPFVDDPALFIETPSVDSTMLQDGCLARSTLYVTNPGVIPQGAFAAGAIQSADIAAGGVAASNLAAGAVVGNLGYVPVNKAGDSGIGQLASTIDTPVSSAGSATGGGLVISTTAANGNNNAYDPAIAFLRAGSRSRYIGLAPTGRFRTVDNSGIVGYLLDTQYGVDTNSYQPGSITLPALAQSLINILIPPGMVRMFGGPNIPPGWLVCDGTAVSRTIYAALFAALGTYWGAGDAITTFNLPDFRGRSPLGYVNSAVAGITARAFASRGGEENHVLSVAELANHNHPLTDGTHAHGITQTPHQHSYVNPIGGLGNQPGSGGYSAAGTAETQTVNANITINAASANISIAATGSNAGHNNLQPFSVLYFIVKT